MKGTTAVITTSDYLINVDTSATKPGAYTLSAVFEAAVAARGDEPAVFDDTRFRSWNEELPSTAIGKIARARLINQLETHTDR